MKEFPFYVAEPPERCADVADELPYLKRDRKHEAKTYRPDPGLVDAVNVALLLGQPLLLTGEPGTGKTQLAYSLECQLNYEVLRFDTKSSSVARDLFYRYDTLGRFHAAHFKQEGADPRQYITYEALGAAILRSREVAEVSDWLPEGFKHGGKQRSIVLIDEIDKAPRDFPNDILQEIDEMSFSVPELGRGDERIVADDGKRPVVVITSNSEKTLPDAFLRRCIYYHISFPEEPALLKKHLREIALTRITAFQGPAGHWLEDALDFFARLRDPRERLEKPPATAELLNWLNYLWERIKRPDGGLTPGGLRQKPNLIAASLGSLLKTSADRERGASILEKWGKVPPE